MAVNTSVVNASAVGTSNNIPNTVRQVLLALQQQRGIPAGTPPTVPGAELLAEMLRTSPGEIRPGAAQSVFTTWGGAVCQLAIKAGDRQSAPAGQVVPAAPSIEVLDGNGKPLAGVVVRFSVIGGRGTVGSGKQRTDAKGIATVGSWTLGNKGPNALRASAGSHSVDFQATAQ